MENLINVNDVVQGIASGNETQHARISIDGLKKILGGKEMRNVTRGSNICDEYGPNLCWGVCNNGNKACASNCGLISNWCSSYGGVDTCDC